MRILPGKRKLECVTAVDMDCLSSRFCFSIHSFVTSTFRVTYIAALGKFVLKQTKPFVNLCRSKPAVRGDVSKSNNFVGYQVPIVALGVTVEISNEIAQ
ncbi:hypothetical protein AX768_04710 [Burkholderia sp. PAMC 28687]|nr:hypothetical protein AX768_04710 [Burkholderia sp. PAMC 28687]